MPATPPAMPSRRNAATHRALEVAAAGAIDCKPFDLRVLVSGDTFPYPQRHPYEGGRGRINKTNEGL